MFNYLLLLIAGMILLIKGADFFVEGSSNVAKALKIPSLIIGLTLVSIGTSAPELSVSITSALQGKDDMSFGNVIGSNIFNVFVVVGASAIMTPLVVSKDVSRKDIPILMFIYFIAALFAFIITPLEISKFEGAILFSTFILYTIYLILRAKNNKAEEVVEEEEGKKKRTWYGNIILIVAGVVGIVMGGDFVVDSASYIASVIGMPDFLISLTIVAVGTSLPELVTSIVAAKKGENDIAVGNAVGSCLFNIILILGVSSMIYPLGLEIYQLVDLLVMFTSIILIFIFTYKSFKVSKWQGLILLSSYVVYLAFIIIRNYM